MSIYQQQFSISFGDCDPAGIVFYPNYLAWMDAVFHGFLRASGGHGGICRDLGAEGLGLMGAEIKFKSPATDGELLTVEIADILWSEKTFDILYSASISDRLVFTSKETRGVFVRVDGRLRAGDVSRLQVRIAKSP